MSTKLAKFARFGIVVCFAFIASGKAFAEEAQRRVALIIGNSDYQYVTRLTNPVNDVSRVAQVFEKAGFDITTARNMTRLSLEDTVRRFLRNASGADVAVVYYSGHGIQVGGENFIVPIDAQLQKPDDLEIEAYSLDSVVLSLQGRTKAQLIFLDACRDFPFPSPTYKVGLKAQKVGNVRGLARVDVGVGTLLAFATAPGSVAQDGGADVSPFSGSFATHALQPNREIRQILSDVRRDVISATAGKQIPWESSSLTEDLFLLKRTSVPVVAPMLALKVAAAGESRGLSDLAPRHPDGDAMTVKFEKVPEIGSLMLGKEKVADGESIPADEMKTLAYVPGSGKTGDIDMVSYAVSDAAGNVARSSIVAVYDAAGEAPVARDIAVEKSETSAFSALAAKPIDVTLGVGPRGLGLAMPTPGEGFSIDLVAAPVGGALLLGDRTLTTGATFAAADLTKLNFIPQPDAGTEPATIKLALRNDERLVVGDAALTIQPKVDDCDRLAGEPLDLQGLGKGVLPNEIDVQAALKACADAVARFPSIGRFRYQYGRAALAAKDIPSAQVAIRTAKGLGHTRAIYEMGYMASVGIGEPQDLAKAAGLFKEAAFRMDPYGLHAYGKALFHGRGVKADPEAGLVYLRRAADLGHTYAMNELGAIYTNGDGVPADPARGAGFYAAGMARGDIYSINNVALAYLAGNEAFPKDSAKALTLFQLAAKGGHPTAPNEIGRLYMAGNGVARDPAEAEKWFRNGIERGDAWAANNLADFLSDGQIGRTDAVEAARLYALSAAFGRPSGSAEGKKALAALPKPVKLAAAKAFSKDLGQPQPPKIDDSAIIGLARKYWEAHGARMDLF